MNESEFLDAALQNPVNRRLAHELLRLKLPDAWIVSGCLVQTVWNVRTRRAVDYGIADYDVFYFDHDVSWQAEDAVIRRLQESFATSGVEARNQVLERISLPGELHGTCPLALEGLLGFGDFALALRNEHGHPCSFLRKCGEITAKTLTFGSNLATYSYEF